MIEEEREVRERVQDQYRFFTVDEYQDISPLQQRLINAWLGSRQDSVLWEIQHRLFSFAGATPVFSTHLHKDFPMQKLCALLLATDQPLKLSLPQTAFWRKGSMGNELVAINEHGSKPTINAYNDEQAEIAGIVREITQLISEGTAAQDIAVLARTNNQIKWFQKTAMDAANLPYQVRNTERFFERKEGTRFSLKQSHRICNSNRRSFMA